MKFAAIVRVSSEEKAKRGESLRTQSKRVQQAVDLRGDEIVKWYKGQEHATPEHERQILDSMLADAKAHKFDAVIVDDPSRWSRDNVRSKADLETLKANEIRFFAGGIEYDLFNPNSYSMLYLQTEMNELFATVQAYKSITNKIERAKRGVPTSGKLPFARTFNREAGTWGIDEEKHEMIKIVADEYCKGASIRHLADRFGVNATYLHKILLKRCGTTWTETFNSKKFGIAAVVTHTIPELLSLDTIRRCTQATAAKKTYNHREQFRKYLLSRMIFCADCGRTLSGVTNHGQPFYRHDRYLPKPCFGFISAKRIEQAILTDIFAWFGGGNVLDKENINTQAAQIKAERKKLDDKITLYSKELKTIATKQDNIVKSIEDGFPLDNLKVKAIKLNTREEELKQEILRLKDQLAAFMTEGELREELARANALQRRMKKGYLKTDAYKKEMAFDDKKELLKTVFGGLDSEGKRLGVYLRKRKGQWGYDIHGIFKDVEGLTLLNNKECDPLS